jgi:hypothetical protein
MNRITRMLTITGLGLFAGVTIGAGPAMAATNTGQAPAKPTTTGVAVKSGDRVEGYYDSRGECEVHGQIGERFGRWDDYDCYRVQGGFHEGDWVLVVDSNRDDGPFGHNRHDGPFDHNGHNDHNDHGFHKFHHKRHNR